MANDVYREKVQADQWSESFVENSDFEYDDLTTYASDGSISKQVQETGGGDSTWDSSANGTYWALAESGDLAEGDGWRETYSDSYDETVWDDFAYGYEIDTTVTVTSDLAWSKTGTREETGGGQSGGLGGETVDTSYATASTYSDGQDSSSNTDHWETTWDYVDDNLYNELITFQNDGGISYAWAEFGGGSGGWDWIASGDDLDQSTWSYDGTDYTSGSDNHRSDSGFETYNYDYEDDLTVTVAADGSDSIGGGWHQWGGGEGNADLHHWGTSSWTEQYTGLGYSSSSYDENTYDILSNDSYLHTFDHSGSYPQDDSYGGEMYGGDTFVSGDYQDTSTSSGNWTETYDDDGYGGPGWTDGDSYSDSYISNISYDELLTDASADFWYYGYGSEQYAYPGDTGLAARAWDDAIAFLTSATVEETDEESTADAEDETISSQEPSTVEAADRSTEAFARDYRHGQTGEPGIYFVSAPGPESATPSDEFWQNTLRHIPRNSNNGSKAGVWKDVDGNVIPDSDLYRGRPSDGMGVWHPKNGAEPVPFTKGIPDFSKSGLRANSGKHNGAKIEVTIEATGTRSRDETATKNAAKNKYGKDLPNGTWHHKDFNPKTGKFTMELVDSTAHAPNHPGGFNDFLNWASDVLANEAYDDLSEARKKSIFNAINTKEGLKKINNRLAEKGARVAVKSGTFILEKAGKKLVIGTVVKLGGVVLGAVAKKLAPPVDWALALREAKVTFDRTGDGWEAFSAAGKDFFMADIVEAPFLGFAELIGNAAGLDERRPEGTPSAPEMMERNRKQMQAPDFDDRLWDDVKRIFRALLP